MTYYYHDTDVIATTTYCGKPVRAVAKCNPEDEYDRQFGEDLALARLNLKVAKKRRARSYEKMYPLDELLQVFERFNDLTAVQSDIDWALSQLEQYVDGYQRGKEVKVN